MSMRIQLSRATVKDLHSGLQHAYRRDDVRLVRRITVLIDLLVHQVPVAVGAAVSGTAVAAASRGVRKRAQQRARRVAVS